MIGDVDGPSVVGDAEFLPFADQKFDLVFSNLDLHWVNDLPGSLVQIARALKSDGLFLGAIFGGDTLHELRDVLMSAELELTSGASPRVSPFAELRDAGGLLQRAGFALPVADADNITVTYDNIFRLMADLRGMGESNVVREKLNAPTRRGIFPAGSGTLRGTLCGSGRSNSRDVSDRLPARLGTAREPTKGSAARHRDPEPRRGSRHIGRSDRRRGRARSHG